MTPPPHPRCRRQGYDSILTFSSKTAELKIKMASVKKHSGTKLDQFQPMVLEISSFSIYAIFSNTLGGYLVVFAVFSNGGHPGFLI